MSQPENLKQGRVMVAQAALGPTPLWSVFLALDRGQVTHTRYVGFIAAEDGESAEQLFARAEVKARAVDMET